MTTLVIVESPGKTEKLGKFLGPEYKVVASVGHIRDLPQDELGVEPPSFAPKYVPTERGRTVISRLRKEIANADTVLLATDPDREGEAISWHLADELKIKNPKRITFNEITKKAVLEAVKNPRKIDEKLVDAQEARRVADRLIGYPVSTALRAHTGSKQVSAGRVQSPAVRLVVDREREIKNFVSIDHYKVRLFFSGKKNWTADWLHKKIHEAKKTEEENNYWTDRDFAAKVSEVRRLKVVSREEKTAKRSPPAPFITSTLQQAGSVSLGIKPAVIMEAAQKLYEQGAITYHRTDYPNLSEDAIAELAAWAKDNGFEVVRPARVYKAKEDAQSAHEAIRPTNFHVESAGQDEVQRKLYNLIRLRAIASQLPDAIYDVRVAILKSIDMIDGISGDRILFEAKGKTLNSPGWLRLTNKDLAEDSESEEPDNPVPALKEGDIVNADNGELIETQTEPPLRYTEASLIKKLESEGIGRPSTYAAIMTKLTTSFVTMDKKYMVPNDAAYLTVDSLVGKFSFIELNYTRALEKALDLITQGKTSYLTIIKGVHGDLEKEMMKLGNGQVPQRQIREQQTVYDGKTYACPNCKKPLTRRTGSRGPFWGCSGYPDCKTILNDKNGAPEEPSSKPDAKKSESKKTYSGHEIGDKCPKCHKAELIKRTFKDSSKHFLGCARYPNCDFFQHYNK